MTTTGSTRVRYHDQQILRTRDFIDEQAYHLAQRRRHNIGGHSWGIVGGLELSRSTDGELSVQAGMAVDGYGRELILPQPYPIDADIFADKGSETLDVYLEYAKKPIDDAALDRMVCRPPGELAANRWDETARVTIRRASLNQRLEAGIDLPPRRQPEEVPEDDIRFSPARVAPDDPDQRWPVFLGQLRRAGSGSSVDLRGRPYAGLVGELVNAPSGWAWLQVGEREDNVYRFGVFLAEAGSATDPATPATPPLGPDKPTLGVTSGGNVEIRADTTVSGDVIVDGGAIEFGDGPEYQSAHPWRIYHTHQVAVPDRGGDDVGDDFGRADGTTEGTPVRDQLRIEMAGADDSESTNEVVIGHWSQQSRSFVPCLTIGDDCRVTVDGDLEVCGTFSALNMTELSTAEATAFVVRAGAVDRDLVPSVIHALTSNDRETAFFDALTARIDDERLLATLVESIQKVNGLSARLTKALTPKEAQMPAAAEAADADALPVALAAEASAVAARATVKPAKQPRSKRSAGTGSPAPARTKRQRKATPGTGQP